MGDGGWLHYRLTDPRAEESDMDQLPIRSLPLRQAAVVLNRVGALPKLNGAGRGSEQLSLSNVVRLSEGR